MFGFLRCKTFRLFNLAKNIYEFITDNHKPFQNCLCKCLSLVITKDRYVIGLRKVTSIFQVTLLFASAQTHLHKNCFLAMLDWTFSM